ncbi:MAG: malate dehydrogenase [candidate division Zixibacteria bacterium]|nr:malate dehydrogenase [Candidatus Tariuqbacter arcticus]
MLNKIGLIGGGNIGGVLFAEIAKRRLAKRIGLIDVKPPDLAKGKALDIAEGSPTIMADFDYDASKEYDALEGSDLVINTAGVPRTKRPDGTIPTREELLATNLKITKSVAEGIQKYCPEAIIVSIANPLDAIVYTLYKILNPPKNKLMGMAGQLDSGRYRYFIAKEAGVSVENVEALVLGGHGDTMVPVRSCCRIAGMPVEKFVAADKLEAIETRTRKAGGEVVGLLGTGSAFVSPAWAALEMTEAIIYDKSKIVATCALLEGEYGIDGLFVGVPAILDAGGVKKVVEVDLSEGEKAALAHSVEAVSKTCAEVDEMLAGL